MIIEKESYFIAKHGIGDITIMGLYKALKNIDIDKLKEEFSNKYPEYNGDEGLDPEEFMKWMIKKHFCISKLYYEVDFEEYGDEIFIDEH